MRRIDYIVLHCTAGPQTQTIENIRAYWRKMGWKKDGYHYLIRPDGFYQNLVPIATPSNGVAGFNAHSIHISYIGGVQTLRNDPVNAYGKPIDNRTAAQRRTMQDLITVLSERFPAAIIQGHRDFSPDKNRNGIIEPSEWMKSCPSFSVKAWLSEINFKSKLPAIILTTTSNVNIRSGAGALFPTVAAPLKKGTRVRVLGTANGWTYVSVARGLKGYVAAQFLK